MLPSSVLRLAGAAGLGLLVLSTADAALVELQASAFPLDHVHLLPGPFKDRLDVNVRYLLADVDPDRLLAGFRQQAGLPEKAKRYGGWEARGINGHGLGHYLSAVAALYAASADPAVKSRAEERVDYIVAELAACQQANGDGYVLPVNKRIYEDLRAGQIKAAGFNLNGEWVPNYTFHKVFAGLRDAYRFAGNRQALQIERDLADYLAGIYEKLSPAQAQEILKAEFGGMNEVFADLTVDTGDPKYLKLAETVFHHDAILGPLKQGRDILDGKHGNTQVPKLVGLARDYLLTGDPADLRGVDTFWKSVVNERSFANGGHGDHEHFFPPVQFPQKLGPQNAETCNTYNMIKLAGMRFSWAPDAADMDFVERGLINHLLTNIGREPGEFGYFLPFGNVAYKTFSTPHDSWWCCVGTGMENPQLYAQQAYFHHDDTLWVNLYLASRLDWAERGFALRQETAFPEADSVRLVIEAKKPVRLALKLRHPHWCAAPEVKINGRAAAVDSRPSSHFALEREWRAGDTIELRLPMTLRTEPLPHSAGKIVALMYGPMQLVARVPVPDEKNDPARRRYGDHLKSPGRVDTASPVLVAADTGALLSAIKPDATSGFGAFRAPGALQPDYPLVPFHRVYQEHYAAYFPFHSPAEWAAREAEVRAAEAARIANEAATLDRVEPGFQQSEVEHKFASEKSETGDFRNRKWRDALPGGWFSYRMAVSPEKPVALVTEHWGSDRGRTHELWIDGHRIAATLRPGKRDGFFEAAYALPPELSRGKREVTVRFVASGARSGTFGLRIVEASAITPGQWAEGLAPLPSNSATAPSSAVPAATDDPLSWTNPIAPYRADPHVYLHTDGWYYFTASVPEYDRVELRRARTLGGLSTAEPKVIWRRNERGPMSKHFWAPEIHFLDGKWYAYFTAARVESQWDLRMYVLENASANPLEGEWTLKPRIVLPIDTGALDHTVFEHRGVRYLVWAQRPPGGRGSNLYIARMDTPWSITGNQVKITEATLAWETRQFFVQEGAAMLIRNGRVFITYSTNSTDYKYCMGLLTADAGSDLLDPKSWTKSPAPVLDTDPQAGQWGPGHNSFTTTPDGKTDILVYHARNYKYDGKDPLNTGDRATRAQVVRWRADGTPDFGTPVPDGHYGIPAR